MSLFTDEILIYTEHSCCHCRWTVWLSIDKNVELDFYPVADLHISSDELRRKCEERL